VATRQDNKDFVVTAFDTLFNPRDYVAAEAFWSPKYVQRSAHIERRPTHLTNAHGRIHQRRSGIDGRA
jgi:hypothetical protein